MSKTISPPPPEKKDGFNQMHPLFLLFFALFLLFLASCVESTVDFGEPEPSAVLGVAGGDRDCVWSCCGCRTRADSLRGGSGGAVPYHCSGLCAEAFAEARSSFVEGVRISQRIEGQ